MADVLNQAEIDKLLNAVNSGELADEPQKEEKPVKVYNFKRPNKFSRDQFRAVQMLHEGFARHLTSSLSSMTRSMVSVEIANVEQVPYEEFVQSVLSPTTLVIMEVEPLSGKAILEINQVLVFSLIDLMLGGKGEPIKPAREFTELERVIVDRIVGNILLELDESWKTVEENIHFSLFGKESNPFFVQIVPKAEMVLLVTIKVQVGAVDARMNLCLPFHTLEPVISRFNPQEWFVSKDKSLNEEEREKLRKRINEISVDLTAELSSIYLPLQDIRGLSEGDVISLETKIDEKGTLKVGPIPKFHISFGTSPRGNLCARVADVIHDEDEQ